VLEPIADQLQAVIDAGSPSPMAADQINAQAADNLRSTLTNPMLAPGGGLCSALQLDILDTPGCRSSTLRRSISEHRAPHSRPLRLRRRSPGCKRSRPAQMRTFIAKHHARTRWICRNISSFERLTLLRCKRQVVGSSRSSGSERAAGADSLRGPAVTRCR